MAYHEGSLCGGVTSIEREESVTQSFFVKRRNCYATLLSRQRGQLTFGPLNKRNLTQLNAINYDTQWY